MGFWSNEGRVPKDRIPPEVREPLVVRDDIRQMPVVRSIPRPAPPPRTVASVYAEREECTKELAELVIRASDVVERREELSIELAPLIDADEIKYQTHLKSLGALKELILTGQQRIVEIREEAKDNAAERAQGEPGEELSIQDRLDDERRTQDALDGERRAAEAK